MGRRFTRDEDGIIIENSTNMTARELSYLLPDDRDYNSVYQRAYRLGVKLKKVDRPWSSEEEEIIINNGHLGYPQLSKLLPHRSANAIQTHSSIMGIRIKRTYTYEPKQPRPKKTKSEKIETGTYSRRWSSNEVKILRYFENLPIMELCILLPRHSAEEVARMKIRLER